MVEDTVYGVGQRLKGLNQKFTTDSSSSSDSDSWDGMREIKNQQLVGRKKTKETTGTVGQAEKKGVNGTAQSGRAQAAKSGGRKLEGKSGVKGRKSSSPSNASSTTENTVVVRSPQATPDKHRQREPAEHQTRFAQHRQKPTAALPSPVVPSLQNKHTEQPRQMIALPSFDTEGAGVEAESMEGVKAFQPKATRTGNFGGSFDRQSSPYLAARNSSSPPFIVPVPSSNQMVSKHVSDTLLLVKILVR